MEQNNKPEVNLRKCKQCGIYKERISSGKFDTYNKRYRQFNGKSWNGSRCGDCHAERAKENMKKLRQKRKTDA